MDSKIISFYKEANIEVEIAKARLQIYEEKKKWLRYLVDKVKREGLENDIKVTKLYIQRLNELIDTIIRKLTDSFFAKVNRIEKIVMLHCILENKPEYEVVAMYPNDNLKEQTLKKIKGKINTALSKISISDDKIFSIVMGWKKDEKEIPGIKVKRSKK